MKPLLILAFITSSIIGYAQTIINPLSAAVGDKVYVEFPMPVGPGNYPYYFEPMPPNIDGPIDPLPSIMVNMSYFDNHLVSIRPKTPDTSYIPGYLPDFKYTTGVVMKDDLGVNLLDTKTAPSFTKYLPIELTDVRQYGAYKITMYGGTILRVVYIKPLPLPTINATKSTSDTIPSNTNVTYTANVITDSPNVIKIVWYVNGVAHQTDSSNGIGLTFASTFNYTPVNGDVVISKAYQEYYVDDLIWLRCMRRVTRYSVPFRMVIDNSQPTTLRDVNLEKEVKIYPIPFDNTLTIESNKGYKLASIVDMEGKVVITTSDKHIDTSMLPKGTYLLKLDNGYVKKVVKN